MSLEYNIILNAYSALILLIIGVHALRFVEKGSRRDRLYIMMLGVVLMMLGVDIMSRFDGYDAACYPALNAIGNFMIFSMNPILPCLWAAYVHVQAYGEEKRAKGLTFAMLAILTANAAMVVLTQFFGWLYTIDSHNVYHRGPLFLVPVLVSIALLIAGFFFTLRSRRRLERRQLISLLFFPIPPFIGMLLQLRFYGMSLVINCAVLSLLVMFLNTQNHSMYTDHLTGVYNRKKFDAFLKAKVSAGAEGKPFAAILMDIYDFKAINDTYGHDAGDHALGTTAKLLKGCLGKNDFVARFGGDEFCVILDLDNKKDLETVTGRIRAGFDKFNAAGSQPYRLNLSMGYAVYDSHASLGPEEFLRKIDRLMYKNKQLQRKALTTAGPPASGAVKQAKKR